VAEKAKDVTRVNHERVILRTFQFEIPPQRKPNSNLRNQI